MFLYHFFWIVILGIGFAGVCIGKDKKLESKILLVGFFGCFLVMLFLATPEVYRGRPINFLTEGITYTMHSQIDMGEYSYLTLEEEQNEKLKLYKIAYWKLRDENSENAISAMPKRFEIKRGTVTYWKGSKSIKAYFIISQESPKSNSSNNY